MVHNNDIVGIFSYNIFVGIAVATIFGSGFFFDLFWPERHESASVKLAWKISSLVVSFMALADALALTVSQIWTTRGQSLIHSRLLSQLTARTSQEFPPRKLHFGSVPTQSRIVYIATIRTT